MYWPLRMGFTNLTSQVIASKKGTEDRAFFVASFQIIPHEQHEGDMVYFSGHRDLGQPGEKCLELSPSKHTGTNVLFCLSAAGRTMEVARTSCSWHNLVCKYTIHANIPFLSIVYWGRNICHAQRLLLS
jgi:hypothetical protein